MLLLFFLLILPIIIASVRGAKLKSILLITLVPTGIIFCLGFLFFGIITDLGGDVGTILSPMKNSMFICIPFYLWALVRSIKLKKEGTKVTDENTLENLENKIKKVKLLLKLKELGYENLASDNTLEDLEEKIKKAEQLQELKKFEQKDLAIKADINDTTEILKEKIKKAKLLQELKELEQKK